jgi:hypothetical protein
MTFCFTFAQLGEATPQSNKKDSPQQQRVEACIASTEKRDFDQLVDAIFKTDGDNHAIAVHAGMQPGVGSVIQLKSILGDRRVAKLHELLSDMEPTESARRISELYSEKLVDYKGEWEAAKSKGGRCLDSALHGMSVLLFLVNEFCGDSTFAKHSNSWLQWHAAIDDGNSPFSILAGPQTLLIINLNAIRYNKREFSTKELHRMVSELCEQSGCGELPKLTVAEFYCWNVREQKDDALIGKFPIFDSWHEAIKLDERSMKRNACQKEAIAIAQSWNGGYVAKVGNY